MKKNSNPFNPGHFNSKLIFRFCALFLFLFSISCKTGVKYVPMAKQVIPQEAFVFQTGEARLLHDPFKISQDAEAKYLLSLDKDRLLAPFPNVTLTPKDKKTTIRMPRLMELRIIKQ